MQEQPRQRRTVRPYRVLLVDLARGFGGVETRVVAQARALQDRVAVCRVATLEGSPLHQRLQAEGVPTVPLAHSRANPSLLLDLWNAIRREGFQVVDAHNVQSVFWGHLAALLAHAPGVVTTIHTNWREEYSGVKGLFYEGVLRLDAAFTPQYILVTETLKEHSIARQHPHNSHVIHNAVPVPPQLLPAKDETLLAEWGFSQDDFIVAIVARLHAVKGHRYLLQAMSHLVDCPQIKLLVVGDGPLREELGGTASELGITARVRFLGMRRDVPRILQSIDCLCLASLWESMPYAVLEGGAYARPIVATAVGGMNTLLEDGKSALLVPPEDAQALADKLRWLSTHPTDARQLGQEAYRLVKQGFSVQTMIDKTLGVYDKSIDSVSRAQLHRRAG